MTPNKIKMERQALREKFDFSYLLAYSVNGGYCPKDIKNPTRVLEVREQLEENCILIHKMKDKKKRFLTTVIHESKFNNFIRKHSQSPRISSKVRKLVKVAGVVAGLTVTVLSPAVQLVIGGYLLTEAGISIYNYTATKEMRKQLRKNNHFILPAYRGRKVERILDSGMKARQDELDKTPGINNYCLINSGKELEPVIQVEAPQAAMPIQPNLPASQPTQSPQGGHRPINFFGQFSDQEKTTGGHQKVHS